jgi:hypothetical protein
MKTMGTATRDDDLAASYSSKGPTGSMSSFRNPFFVPSTCPCQPLKSSILKLQGGEQV